MENKGFFQSETWKKWSGIFYSAGASVVIVGALFKIMHWPGASIVLTAGMLTEAFLFLIGVTEKPHAELHWQNVYPQLLDDPEEGVSSSAKVAKNGTPNLDNMPDLKKQDSEKLAESIKKLSETAAGLVTISSASAATDEYVRNISSANSAISSFASSQKTLADSTNSLVESYKGVAASMNAASADSKSFAEKLNNLNSTLSSVNASYELQLKNMTSDSNSFGTLSESFDKIKATMEASVRETEAFKDQTTKLTQQVSNLNSIYGGMLNAMNIAR